MKLFRVDECYECGHKRMRFDSWRVKYWVKYTVLRRPRPPVDPALVLMAEVASQLLAAHRSIFADLASQATLGTGTTIKWGAVSMPNLSKDERAGVE